MPTSSSALTLTAYAGDGAVLLGFSLDPSELKTHDLVGFSIQCTPPAGKAFFLECAFFSFHLLMAYLVDHISIHLAFAICSAVSVILLVSYLRLVVGMRFAALEAGLAQVIYLILFSYAFFFEGFTGLAITIGAILTLFITMQMTARVRWSEKFTTGPVLG